MLRWTLGAGLISLLAVAAAGLVYVGIHPPLVFAPDRVIDARPPDVGIDYRDLALRTNDGVIIRAWWVETAQDGAPAIAAFFDARGDLGDRLAWISLAREAGFHVLAVEYRGFGASGGEPSAAGFDRDALAAYAWLTERRRIPAHRVVAFGRGVGAAVAAGLAARRPVGLLVVESAFTSLPEAAVDVAAQRYGRRAPVWLMRIVYWSARFDTRARLMRVDAPTLIMHSRADGLVPFAHAQRLEAAHPRATLSQARGARANILDTMGFGYFVPITAAYEAARRGR